LRTLLKPVEDSISPLRTLYNTTLRALYKPAEGSNLA